MIYIQSAGRLGNQLFQVAMALRLRSTYSAEVTLFADSLHSQTKDPFADLRLLLGRSFAEVNLVGGKNALGRILATFDKLRPSLAALSLESKLRMIGVYREFDPFQVGELPAQRPRLVSGYFQNPLELQPEIVQIANQISRNLEPLSKVKYQALHVRRFDSESIDDHVISHRYFVENLKTGLPLILCSDLPSTEHSFRKILPKFDFFSPASSTTVDTFRVIAGANHVITSNSTFSWWAALVAHLRGASVCIPRRWDPSLRTPLNHFKILDFESHENEFSPPLLV